jgi:hypothetical protein
MVFTSFGNGVQYGSEGADFVSVIQQTAVTLTERWSPVVGMLRYGLHVPPLSCVARMCVCECVCHCVSKRVCVKSCLPSLSHWFDSPSAIVRECARCVPHGRSWGSITDDTQFEVRGYFAMP